MNFSAFVIRRQRWLGLPTVSLLALLQRTPALRVATAAGEFALESPAGSVLRSAVATAASLGALHSLAGATTLSSTSASPLAATAGTAIPTVVFGVAGTQAAAASWQITGTLPAGLSIEGQTVIPIRFNVSNPRMLGTPTTPGSYQLTLQAWEGSNRTLNATPIFTYTINVGQAAATAPTISSQPLTQTATIGQSVVFSVVAGGTAPLTFQWRKDGAALSGQNASSLTLPSVTSSSAGVYSVVVTNSAGSAISTGATLTVTQPTTAPIFSLQPAGQMVANGGTVVFSAATTSATAVSYQWQKGGVNLAGATTARLVLRGVTAGSAGNYICVATNSGGSTSSSSAVLGVSSTADAGRLVNLSIRTFAGNGDQTLFVGMAVGGPSGTQPVLIRVTGPALAAFGVPNTLVDPVLTLLSGDTTVGANDNWGGTQPLKDVSTSVGAFPITDTNSKDAVLYNSAVAAGTYSVKVTGVNGGTGIALAELYDATAAGTFKISSSPRLINASARTQVDTGDNVLIAGFAIGGSTSKTVMIRAIGPTLTGFGVNGALADPVLELAQSSGVIAINDDWGGDAQLTTVGLSVGAFELTNTASKDAILLITLPPGTYSAKVSGVNNGTGVALVELYDIP